jgi:hypothetical protein
MRLKLLRDIDDPNFAQSKTDSEEPMLAIPSKENDDPKRDKLLRESDAPRFTQSNTDRVAPKRAKLLKDKDEPSVAQSKQDREDPASAPTRNSPKIASDDPSRAKLRKENVAPK